MSRVFISYAREDEPTGVRLYQDLKALGADPWMDKYDLRGRLAAVAQPASVESPNAR
jgi:hypothetical protein